jgi:rhomboid protease GluP
MWGFAPVLTKLGRDMGFVPFVITSCAVLYGLTLFASPQIIGILGPGNETLFVFGASGYIPVFVTGRWWTLLTASWLHANAIHILMNMMSARNIAPIVAETYGASRMIIIYVLSGVAGFALSVFGGPFFSGLPVIGSFLSGSPITVGASASITGLIGAVYYYGHRTGSSNVTEQSRMWVISFLIMGAIFPAINNLAHIGGLAGGYLIGKFLDPLQRERLDHFLVAIGLLVVSAIAVVYSIITGLAFLRT